MPTLLLGIPVEMVQFLLKLLLKQRYLAVQHDFHRLSQSNFVPFMLTSRSRKFWQGRSREPEILDRLELESDILPPTLQPCRTPPV